MIPIKSDLEMEKMAKAGRLLATVREALRDAVRVGIGTKELDDMAEKMIRAGGARPAFKGYGNKNNPYPATICASIDDVVVHGIPSSADVLKEGMIISVDLGLELDGFFADSAFTKAVGKISQEDKKLINATEEALAQAIEMAVAGNRVGDISYAIQKVAEKSGFSPIRDLVGHGIGERLHEEPAVPCFGKAGEGPVLAVGMVLAIEPMIAVGDWRVETGEDGWTVRTADGSKCAHVEHTVAITKNGPVVLTLT